MGYTNGIGQINNITRMKKINIYEINSPMKVGTYKQSDIKAKKRGTE